MSAHTPGPWEAGATDRVLTGPHREEHASWYVTGENETDDGVLVAKLDSGDTGAETEANARLIAAAPDLLAALKAMFANACDCGPDVHCRSCELGLRAIAKAEGES